MTCAKHGYCADGPCPDCAREVQARLAFVREASLRIAGTVYARHDLSHDGAKWHAQAIKNAAEILADELGFPRP